MIDCLLTRSSIELNLKLLLFQLFVEWLSEIKGAMLTTIYSDIGQIMEDLIKKKQLVPKLHIKNLDNMVFQQYPDWDLFWICQTKAITLVVSSVDSPLGRI